MPPNRRRDDDDDDDYDRPRPRKKARKQQSSNLPLIIGAVVVGGVLAAGGLAVAVVMFSDRDPEVVQAPPPIEPQPQFKGPPKLQPANPGPTAGVPRPDATSPSPKASPRTTSPKSSPAPAKPSGKVGIEIGDTALEIDGEDIDGKKFKLSDYRGKVVVLDFWGDW